MVRNIHKILGLFFGLFLFIICLSGAALEFIPRSTTIGMKALQLHRWMLDIPAQKGDMTFGKLLVALSTLAMLGLIITGIVLWWRQGRIKFLRSLTVIFGKGTFPLLRSSHVAIGMYVSLLMLAIVLTGLTWSFGWWRNIIYGLFPTADTSVVKGMIYGLHTGNIGGMITKIIWFLAALFGMTLPVTGYWMWFRKCKKKRK